MKNGVVGSRINSNKWKFGGGIFRYNEAISDSSRSQGCKLQCRATTSMKYP